MKFWYLPAGITVLTALVVALTGALTDWLLTLAGADHWAFFFAARFAVAAGVIALALELLLFKRLKTIYKILLRFLKRRKRNGVASERDVVSGLHHAISDISGSITREFREMKELDLFRKEYIGVVSHELKTPIFVIEGYLETLMDGALEDESVNRKFISQSLKNVQRLNNLVHDLIVISQLESGQMEMKKESFRIYTLIMDVFEQTSQILSVNDTKPKLILETNDNEGVYVIADKDRIRQVVMNLVTNAIRYGREENGFVKVEMNNNDDKLYVSVIDNGVGIDQEHLAHIFERFYRIEKSRSRGQGGTGLGLSIVKNLLDAHGEEITVESKPGEGATFTFSLTKDKRGAG